MDLQTIARLSLDCQRNFQALSNALKTTNENELSSVAVEDELGRFRIWAANIGALNIGTASLDYRLRDAEYLRQEVISLLKELKKNLDIGLSPLSPLFSDVIATSLVTGDRSSDESASESESDTSLESISPPSVKSESVSQLYDNANFHPLQDYYDEVVDVINTLFDNSILIRKASRKFRTTRAAAHIEKDGEGNDVLLEFKSMISLRIKGLWPQTPPWLVDRLADVIAKRRQQFYYQRAHMRKLARVPTILQEEARIVSRQTGPSRPVIDADPSDMTKRNASIPEPRLPAAPQTTKSRSSAYTTASELIHEEPQSEPLMDVKPTPTEIVIGNIFPKPPKSSGYAFECNQCFHMLHDKMRESELWRFALLCFPTKPELENTSFPTFDRTPVSQSNVKTTINYSRLGKNGLIMSSNSIIMNGGATLLTTMIHLSEYFYRRKNLVTIFSKSMPSHSRNISYLTFSPERDARLCLLSKCVLSASLNSKTK